MPMTPKLLTHNKPQRKDKQMSDKTNNHLSVENSSDGQEKNDLVKPIVTYQNTDEQVVTEEINLNIPNNAIKLNIKLARENGFTIAPIAPYYPITEYPQTNKETGEVTPKFTGKRISFIDERNHPIMLDKWEVFKTTFAGNKTLEMWFANPDVGIAFIGTEYSVLYDLDRKNFDNKEECDTAFFTWKESVEKLIGKKFLYGKTQGDGWRVPIKLIQPCTFTNFTHEQGSKNHVGEIRGKGKYAVVCLDKTESGNPYTWENDAPVLEVTCLEEISIYSTAQVSESSSTDVKEFTHMGNSADALNIKDLLSKRNLAISNGESEVGKRSDDLTALIKDVLGWQIWLEINQFEYLDNIEELLLEAANSLDVDENRLNRIRSGLTGNYQPACLYEGNEADCWKKIKYASAKVGSDAYSKCPKHIRDEIEGFTTVRALIADKINKESTTQSLPTSNGKNKQSQNDFVSELKHQYNVEVIKDSNSGEVYLKITHENKGIEVLELNSAGCKNFINRCAQKILGTVLKPDDFNLVKTIIETEASENNTPSYPLNIRVGRNGNKFCIDQGDINFNVYSITNKEITLTHNQDNLVLFKRPNNLDPLPTPNLSASPIESFNALRQLCLHIPEESVWLLWYGIAYNLTALPDKPLIILKGFQGSGKTAISNLIKKVIDPSKCDSLSAPKDEQDLMIQANQNWVLYYDNLSPKAITSDISDYLCKMSTGSGFMTRTLYTNSEATMFKAMRPVVINGIENVARRPDLLDRALIIDVPEIPEDLRISREEQAAKTSLLLPIILGGIMNALKEYLQVVENNYSSTVKLLRMADFHKFAVTLEHACLLPSNITEVYTQNRVESTEDVATSDPICLCIMSLLTDPSRKGIWKGTATELLNILTHIKNHSYHEYLKETSKEAWVSSPKHLSERLKRITPALRTQGYVIEVKKSNGVRSIIITKQDVDTASKVNPQVQLNKSFLERIVALPCSLDDGSQSPPFVYPDIED